MVGKRAHSESDNTEKETGKKGKGKRKKLSPGTAFTSLKNFLEDNVFE